MSTYIVTKIVLCIVGVLLLIQVLFYNGAQLSDLARSRNEGVRLSQEIEQLSLTKQELQQYLAGLVCWSAIGASGAGRWWAFC